MLTRTKESFREFLFFFAAGVIFVVCFLFICKRMGAIADEPCHYRMIGGILGGRNLFPMDCPYLPIYHWTIATLYWLTHFRSPIPTEVWPLCPQTLIRFLPNMIRLLSACFSFTCVAVIFFLAKTINNKTAISKASFFLFFPLFFPYFFLIYTDIYAMLYLFLALLFAIKRRLWLSGIFGILAVIVRQTNIIWIGFIVSMVYLEDYYPQYKWKDVRQWILKFSPFLFALIAFIAIVVSVKGFVVADRNYHYVTFSFDHLFFLLFLFFFLFLPQNLANAPKVLALLKRNKFIGPALVGVFLGYYFFFKANHLYNSLSTQFQLFLHNWVLEWMRNPSFWSKGLTFLPIGYSILSLCVTRLERRSFYLLYPFTVLFLIPFSVIEIRYFFVPLTLFILFEEQPAETVTFATLALNITAISCLLMAMTVGSAYFFP